MTPAARRLLDAAAQHRRRAATRRWFAHHAGTTASVAEAALQELAAEGLVVKDDRMDGGNPVYHVSQK